MFVNPIIGCPPDAACYTGIRQQLLKKYLSCRHNSGRNILIPAFLCIHFTDQFSQRF